MGSHIVVHSRTRSSYAVVYYVSPPNPNPPNPKPPRGLAVGAVPPPSLTTMKVRTCEVLKFHGLSGVGPSVATVSLRQTGTTRPVTCLTFPHSHPGQLPWERGRGASSSKYIHILHVRSLTVPARPAVPCPTSIAWQCPARPCALPSHGMYTKKRLCRAEVTLTRTDATYIQMCDQYRQALLGNGIAALWLTTSCDFFFAFVTRRNADGRDDRIIRRRLIGWRPARVGRALQKRRSSLTYPRKETAFL